MKARGGGGKVQLYSFLKPALEPGKWPTPRPGRFATGKHQVPLVHTDGKI
jgi:hypothetical protein